MSGRRALLLPGLLAFLLYLPSLHGAFLYDDAVNVVTNRALGAGLGAVLRHEPARPLLSLSFALNHALSGLEPWSYHLANALIHAANAMLAASLFLWLAARGGRRDARGGAIFAACLFAVTPMAVETVAYVSSRSTGLCALFMLASLRLAVDGLERPRPPRVAAALGLFVLALLTKEEAASLPLLLLLVDAFFLGAGDLRAPAARLRYHAAFLALPVIGLLARRLATGAWLPPPAVDHAVYLVTQASAFPLYLARAALPFDPAFFRGHVPSPWPPDGPVLLLAGIGLLLLALAVALRRRHPLFAFAVLWMAAALVPSSSLAPLREMVVDHRAYLGGAGVLFALGRVLWAPGRLLFGAALVALLSARSVQYQRVLGDPIRAWEDAVTRAPHSAEAWRALGEAYGAVGDGRAEWALQQAVRLGDSRAQSWANLGVYYLSRQRRDEALVALRRAAAAAPRDARIRDNLGVLLEAEGRTDEARAEYEAAVAGTPRLAQPRIRLAQLLLEGGQSERARRLLDEAAALEIDAEDARAIEAVRARLP